MDDETRIRERLTERWLSVDALGTPVAEPARSGFGAFARGGGGSLSDACYARTVAPEEIAALEAKTERKWHSCLYRPEKR